MRITIDFDNKTLHVSGRFTFKEFEEKIKNIKDYESFTITNDKPFDANDYFYKKALDPIDPDKKGSSGKPWWLKHTTSTPIINQPSTIGDNSIMGTAKFEFMDFGNKGEDQEDVNLKIKDYTNKWLNQKLENKIERNKE